MNAALMRSLHDGTFLAAQRTVVLVGGTGSGKTHLAIAITAHVIRAGARGRFFNVVDLVNRLEQESRHGKPRRAPRSIIATPSGCSACRPADASSEPAVVLEARPVDDGVVGIRLLDVLDQRWDCVAPPPVAPCYEHEEDLDPAGGEVVGWLSSKVC